MNIMKCKEYDDKTKQAIKFPCFVQRKADACRIQIERTEFESLKLYSSTGSAFLNLPELEAELFRLPAGYVYDGELYFGDLPRESSNGLANKSIKGTISPQEASMARVVLWDVIPIEEHDRGFCSVSYVSRWEDLENYINRASFKHITLIDNYYVSDYEEIDKWFQYYLDKGEEGIIVKNLDGPWESKRSTHCLKRKDILTADLRVISMVEGQGKNAGMMGSLFCQSDDGKVSVWVGGGFTDAMRKQWWAYGESAKGRIVEVKYNRKISDKRTPNIVSLYLPRFVRERDDKLTTNMLEDLKN